MYRKPKGKMINKHTGCFMIDGRIIGGYDHSEASIYLLPGVYKERYHWPEKMKDYVFQPCSDITLIFN